MSLVSSGGRMRRIGTQAGGHRTDERGHRQLGRYPAGLTCGGNAHHGGPVFPPCRGLLLRRHHDGSRRCPLRLRRPRCRRPIPGAAARRRSCDRTRARAPDSASKLKWLSVSRLVAYSRVLFAPHRPSAKALREESCVESRRRAAPQSHGRHTPCTSPLFGHSAGCVRGRAPVQVSRSPLVAVLLEQLRRRVGWDRRIRYCVRSRIEGEKAERTFATVRGSSSHRLSCTPSLAQLAQLRSPAPHLCRGATEPALRDQTRDADVGSPDAFMPQTPVLALTEGSAQSYHGILLPNTCPPNQTHPSRLTGTARRFTLGGGCDRDAWLSCTCLAWISEPRFDRVRRPAVRTLHCLPADRGPPDLWSS